MNSIKSKSLLFAVLLAGAVFQSCSSEDKEPNPIVGTWESKQNFSVLDVTYTYVFTNDMHYTWSTLSTVMDEGTYTINGNSVYLTSSDPYYAESELRIKGDRLYDPSTDSYYTKK